MKIVMIDFDDTASLSIPMFATLFDIFKANGFRPMICTSRSKDDPTNNEITDHFGVESVIFCEGYQKLDFVRLCTNIDINDIAFWIDNDALSIPAISDIRDLAESDLIEPN